ncbi:MAG: hypothetical protein Q7R65_03035 [bacterium]|nr:hypothetical protein [bacterium]
MNCKKCSSPLNIVLDIATDEIVMDGPLSYQCENLDCEMYGKKIIIDPLGGTK